MALPDAIYRNAIDLNRFGNKVSTDVSKRFVDICVQSVRQLAELDRKGLGDSYRAARLRSIVAQLEKSLSNWKKFANTNVVRELQGLAGVQAGFIEKQLTQVIPRGMRQNIQVNGIEISPKFAESVVSVDPTKIRSRAVGKQLAAFLGESELSDNLGAIMTLPNGNIVQQAFDKIAEDSVQLFRRTVQDGLLTGETTPQITRRLLGNSREGDNANILQMAQKGGIMTTPPINQVRTLVRTSINQVSNNAALSVYRANSDITKKYRYTATLDSRTTAVCGALDGRVFEYEQGPMPPQHFNCRSTIIPEIDYDNLPFDPPPTGRKRASADGPVSANMDYSKWLFLQPQAVKARILGGNLNPATNKYEGAFRYFERLVGKEKDTRKALSKFVRADGSRVSLMELKNRYGKPENIPVGPQPRPVTAKPIKRKPALGTYAPTKQPKIAVSRGKDIVGGRLQKLDGFRKDYKKLLREHSDLSVERKRLVDIINNSDRLTQRIDARVEYDKVVTALTTKRAKIRNIEKQGALQMFDIRKEAIANSAVTRKELKNALGQIDFTGDLKATRERINGEMEEFGLMFNGAGITKKGRFIKGRSNQIKTVQVRKGRAHNEPEFRGTEFSKIKVPATSEGYFGENDAKATLFHEIGHSLEGFEEKNLDLAVAFRTKRIKSDFPVSPKKLKGTIMDGYAGREAVLTDTFIAPYVGRPYKQRTSADRTPANQMPKGLKPGQEYDSATEVISMGVEHFSDPESMFRLYQADPEHFYMILSLTRTVY